MWKVRIFLVDGRVEEFTANQAHEVHGDMVTWDVDEFKNVTYNESEIKKIEEIVLEDEE